MGPYKGIDMLLNNHLSFHAIRNELASKLGSLIPIVEKEMEYALDKEIRCCKGLCNDDNDSHRKIAQLFCNIGQSWTRIEQHSA
jgi:hypothetical protein